MPELTPAVMNLIHESVALAIPPTPLILTPKKVDPAARHPGLDKVVQAVEALQRPRSAAHIAVPVYIRGYQLSPSIVQQMIADFKAKRAICHVSYHLERMTDTLYGYRMMVHVNPALQ
jgi:hypothetical protein